MMFALSLATMVTGRVRKSCHVTTPIIESAVELDYFGNPVGDNNDLGGSVFDASGQKIYIIDLITKFSMHMGFEVPGLERMIEDLRSKGFEVILDQLEPSEIERSYSISSRLEEEKPTQLWIIDSSDPSAFSPEEFEAIKKFYHAGNSLLLSADNFPFNVNVNKLANELIGATVSGDYPGNKTLKSILNGRGAGFVKKDITTGINNLYVGHTIAAITPPEATNRNGVFSPVMYDVDKNNTPFVVVAQYEEAIEKAGKRSTKRLIIDGGFTRLFQKFYATSPGTERFVKNCAVWLSGKGESLVDQGEFLA